jgi:uncharacterized membrane protein
MASTPPATGTYTEKPFSPATRIQSIDILRGLVMVLMAIDHVRVYSGIPAGSADPGIFFTRWITHFCAPGFAFLAGTGAFLYGHQLNDKRRLARYLVTRGLLLVLLELTVIRFTWTFNLRYTDFLLAGVIWMLGWCMVLLAAFVRLRPVVVGSIGLAIIFFQQVFHWLPQLLPQSAREPVGWFWSFLYPSDLEGVPGITILYVLVPWLGVMAAGYGFGAIMLFEPAGRRKICLWIGLSAIAVFLVAGSIVIFSAPASPDAMPFVMQLLNQRKYPASPLYLLMALGPVIALLPAAERMRGWLASILRIFGRVPLFYYLLHIPLIHLAALLVNLIREGNTHQEWYTTAPFTQMPWEHQWGLPLLYLVFLLAEIILFIACRWYVNYKINHPGKKWLRYL